MSDYLDGSKGDAGAPIEISTSMYPIVPAATHAVQVRLTADALQISAAPHQSVVLYDHSGQLMLQTVTDAEGLRDIPRTACPAGVCIVATPIETVKVLIP